MELFFIIAPADFHGRVHSYLKYHACTHRRLKMPGPISQNGNFYSNDASPPKISWF